MAMEMRQKTNRQQGFTLLEILVVVAIMGFLVAMVAPRFAGIVSGTSEIVCNTSKGRGAQMVSTFFEQNNRYPSGLVNLVMSHMDGDNTVYQVPYVSDDNPDNGREVLRNNHNNNFKFMIHYLNKDEADELRDLGITMVYNLNEYGDVLGSTFEGSPVEAAETVGRRNNATHTGRTENWQTVTVVGTDQMRPGMERANIQAGVGVIMSTIGASNSTDNNFDFLGNRRPPSGRNDYFGRIIFGLGPESELVTSGMATRAGISPTATTADDFIWGGYYLVMPRLQATVDRLKATGATLAHLTGTGGGTQAMYAEFLNSGEVRALGAPRGTSYEASEVTLANPKNLTERTVNLLKAMEPWDFATNPVHEDLRWSMVWGSAPN